ncbi:MAG: lytic transglycosylase domain-containing protein [Acidobacteria bacterium]|nr:lytic transglycosylase domain-containing protein [Acidobacteriota bacterium]MCA1627558.1 lytic transglycosylase domain-containing protein [Acidobacteriota bacterium]
MKQLLIITIVTLFSAGWAAAQTGYRVDNLDLPNAVQVQTPKSEPKSYPKRLVRLTSYIPTNPSLGGFTTGNTDIDNFIVESGKRNSVDPLLLYSIMHQESSFKPRALSYKGARGLMQLMPPTAARFGVTNIWDPKQNIEGGARYMRFLLNLFEGDVHLALAGYNAGEGAVMKYGRKVPPYSETQEYVRRIGRRYSLIRDPAAAANANQLTSEQFAGTKQKKSAPLNVYEPTVFMARTPDGRLQLVSQ